MASQVKRALIIGSNGSEEMELIITSDVLRRAGVEVIIAGLQDEPAIVCRSLASINVDKLFKDVLMETFDAVILPGGLLGSECLQKDSRVGDVLRQHEAAGKIIAAICAGPLAIKAHNISSGGTLTSYPAVKNQFDNSGYTYSEDNVCVWKNLVTSRGPGTTFDFALKLAELLAGTEKAHEVRKAMLLA
ncbi:DJ-1/PfpI family domain-containing protein [Ditylenchus destructor]|nr:DJ-1/PfpI family domain-containing protein [Ditylenchus destructor]